MSRRPADVAFAAGACVVLAGYNNVAGARPWHRRWYPAVNALAASGLLAAASAIGLTLADLGLRRDRLRAGIRLGSAVAAPVAGAFGLAALTPAARPLLDDQRVAGLGRGELAYQVLLRIPVGTVAWEEIAFRGVLLGALRRVLAEPAATAAGSLVFGLWHIRPTVEALEVNGLAGSPGARVAAVTAVVGGTAGAGVLLCLLRERSGSLVAPVLLHLAANCAGAVASALASALARRPVAAGLRLGRSAGGGLVMAGPEDRAAAGGDRLRAGHADRERVVQALKDAFVQGRLTRDELDVRAGRALAARTRGELAALTADIPAAAGPALTPASASAPARPSLVQRRPVVYAVAGSGSCVAVAFGLIMFAANVLDPAGLGNPYHPWSGLCALVALVVLIAGFGIAIHGLGTAAEQRYARRQLRQGGRGGARAVAPVEGPPA